MPYFPEMTAAAQAIVSTDGQVTLRRSLLDQIGARPGDRLTVVALPNGHLDVAVDEKVRAVADGDLVVAAKKGSWDDFFGSIKNDGSPPLTIEEMNEVIAQGWAGELDGCD